MDNVLTEIANIGRKFKSIQRIVLFGSRAKGNSTPSSDYDIAVFGADIATQALFSDALDEIPTLHKIDLVFIRKKHLGTPIFDSIQKEGIIIMDKFSEKLVNFGKAVKRLKEAIDETERLGLNILKDAVIQRFEFTTELAWKTAREYLLDQGEIEINSPKPTMRVAYRAGIIKNEQGWIMLLEDRNKTSHVYDDEEADEVFRHIVDNHFALLVELYATLQNVKY